MLEGANPESMEEDVTEVLEEHLNTIAGLRSLRSTTFHGVTMIQAEFELERDIDQAAQDVRDKIARARFELPRSSSRRWSTSSAWATARSSGSRSTPTAPRSRSPST